MKNALLYITLIFTVFSSSAQIMVPDDYTPVQTLERTGTQKAFGTTSDITAVALPVAAIAGTIIAEDWEGLTQYAFTTAANVGVTYILKYTIRELRPDHSDYHSFPSFHSSQAFATAAFLQRRYGWKFGAPAYALATYTAVGRVLGKKHHWWDCAAGAAIGVASAYFFTTPWAQKHEFAIIPTATDQYTGFSASMTF